MPKIFITILLTIGIIIASYFYVLPEWRTFQDSKIEIARLQVVNEKLDHVTDIKNSLLQKSHGITAVELERLDYALPLRSNAADFAVLVENIVSKNGFTLRAIDVGAGEGDEKVAPPLVSAGLAIPSTKKYKSFVFSVSLTGSYEALKNLLRDLENSLRIIDVEILSFTESNKVFQFKINGRAYQE